MSSKAEVQSTIIISVAHGAIKELYNDNRFSHLGIKEELSKLSRDIGFLKDEWVKNHTTQNHLFAIKQTLAWTQFIKEIGMDEGVKTNVLVKLATMAVCDLYEKLNNSKKKKQVGILYDNLTTVDNFIDPDGKAFTSLDGANVILNSLYKEIGFGRCQ